MRRFLLTAGASVLAGAGVLLIGRLGGWGFGAFLAISLSKWFAFAVGAWQPRAAPLHMALLTGTCAGLNCADNRAAGRPGGTAEAFWFVWAVFAFWSGWGLLGGIVFGWATRRAGRDRA